jgi:hypothetical protein
MQPTTILFVLTALLTGCGEVVEPSGPTLEPGEPAFSMSAASQTA